MPPARPVEFSAIQSWLRESPPITDIGTAQPATISFAELWVAIAYGASHTLVSGLPVPPEPAVLRDLHENLTLRLSRVGEGSVWQHFNAHRTLHELVKAHLEADEHGCRRTLYCRVLEALRADGLQELTDNHPVLRRHLSATVASWLASSRELLARVERDHAMLAETFNIPADARLTGVKTGISDPHRGGRSVAILTFAKPEANQVSAEGETTIDARNVVYKPRDLRIDAAYHRLISELSGSTPDATPLQSLTVLPRDGYGYTEYVAHVICSSNDELAEFYRNAGRLTAILYVLGCNDCHNENVIAHGDQLILVDAETLLQGMPRRALPDPASATARKDLEARIIGSVVRIGVLPHWFFIAGERTPQDVSALGIKPPKTAQETYAGWSALNTDGMVSGQVKRDARVPTSLPVGTGSPNRLDEFTADYRAGFVYQLETIAADKGPWLADDGYLERFRDLRSRFIRRETWIYLWIRGQLQEASALKDEAAQHDTLTRLSKPTGDDADAHDDIVLRAEWAQLRDLDVPYFEHPIAGHDLLLGDDVRCSGFFARSGLDSARGRIESLGTSDIRLQVDLIDSLMTAKAARAHRGQRPDGSLARRAVGVPTVGARLDAATAVGELLINTSVGDDCGNVEWVGIDSAADLERSCYGPLGPSLYGGRMGIALFLGALAQAQSGRRAPGDVYHRTAAAACAEFVRLVEAPGAVSDMRRWWRDQPLGLAGSGGQLLTAVLLRSILPEMDRALTGGVAALLDGLEPEFLSADDDLDIIFGCAGLIGALLKIGTPKAVELAQTAGDRLVDRQDGEGGWIVASLGARALTGFSHGASGMAAALAKLGAVTCRPAFHDAAARALKYERSQYDAREGNWPDYRDGLESTEPKFMVSWCHGAPGIALARLCLKSTPLWQREAQRDLRYALAATTNATLPEDSLCCGRFGRAAILRAAQERGCEKRWLESARHLEAQALAQLRTDNGYRFGDVLGLFQGAAGIGLALLDGPSNTVPDLVPAVLSAGLID